MKHRHIAKKFWKNKSTPMLKAAEAMNKYDDILNLSIGDSDFTTDEEIIKSAMQDALNGHTKYTNPRGDKDLILEIEKFYKEDYNLTLKTEEIFVTTSSCMGMELALMSILDPEDEVIIFSPYFTPYSQQIILAGGKPVEVKTFESEGWEISPERLREAISERTKAVIINTPCNPTGAVLNSDSYALVALLAKEHDLIVIADEIYTQYAFESEFVPFISNPDMEERTITLNSFSKNYMMAGWRIGYIIAPAHIVSTLLAINENFVYTAPSISQRAAIYALRNRGRIKEEYVLEYKRRVYYAAERINSIPFLSVRRPEGTFYLFVNIQNTGLNSVEFCDKLLDEAHIVAIPGVGFGSAGEGYIRIACTMGIEKLSVAFDRIEKLRF